MEEIKRDDADEKSLEKNHPFKKANFLSKVLFTWLVPLFHKGYKNDLTEDDLFPNMNCYDSTMLGDKLEAEWMKELKKPKPSLWLAIVRVFGKEMTLLGLWYLLIELLRLMQPLALSKLLEFYNKDSNISKEDAYIYSCIVIMISLVGVLGSHLYLLHQFLLGRKVKIAASALVYRKTLKLSKSALADTTIGQMVNLISNDVGRFESVTKHIHDLWVSPLELIIVIILMYFYVGLTGLVGVLLLVGYFPFQMWVGKQVSKYRLRTALRTDERIRLMDEIITGIQVIKMYTWEKPFARLVEISRKKEIQEIKRASVIRGIVKTSALYLTKTSIYLCIVTYVLTGNILTAQYVFVLKSFYEILRKSVTNRYPQGAMEYSEAKTSINRIKKFLMHDEVIAKPKQLRLANVKKIGVHFENASFRWMPQSEDCLKDISINVSQNELATVIGSVGSGKSTLLHAVLAELTSISGLVEVTGKVSYASQEPWLFVGSVRHNILFGQTYDHTRYQEIIRICALERDLTLLPYGDRTVVGERGVSLSGGQKSRISLARAIYYDADIYLLDDPLSAVDANVGKHIFEECVKGYLKNKCVVLVTHQLQYLKDCKKIYLLENGRIIDSGTYDDIAKNNESFMKIFAKQKDAEEHEEGVDKETGEDAPSVKKRLSKVDQKEEDKDRRIAKEGRGTGKIKTAVYKSYFYSGGHCGAISVLLGSFIISQAMYTMSEYYLTIWVNMEQQKATKSETVTVASTITSTTLTSISYVTPSSEEPSVLESFFMAYMTEDALVIAYTCLIMLIIGVTIFRALYFYFFCLRASRKLHNNMFNKIVFATMRFFNTNPSGRVLNRFSMDMNQVDEVLPLTLLDTLQTGLDVFATTIVISSINPWMILATVVILTIFYFLRIIYISTSRDIKRLEGVTRSPVYSHLSASLHGLTTIRSLGAQDILKMEFDKYQNRNTSAHFTFLALGRSFGLWLDLHCVAFIALVTLSFLLFDNNSLGGTVGLSITQALALTGSFQWGMRQCSELENQMTCVERIKEYADTVPENDDQAKETPKHWPDSGAIRFNDLSLRYFPDDPPVLKNLSFHIRAGEKIG